MLASSMLSQLGAAQIPGTSATGYFKVPSPGPIKLEYLPGGNPLASAVLNVILPVPPHAVGYWTAFRLLRAGATVYAVEGMTAARVIPLISYGKTFAATPVEVGDRIVYRVQTLWPQGAELLRSEPVEVSFTVPPIKSAQEVRKVELPTEFSPNLPVIGMVEGISVNETNGRWTAQARIAGGRNRTHWAALVGGGFPGFFMYLILDNGAKVSAGVSQWTDPNAADATGFKFSYPADQDGNPRKVQAIYVWTGNVNREKYLGQLSVPQSLLAAPVVIPELIPQVQVPVDSKKGSGTKPPEEEEVPTWLKVLAGTAAVGGGLWLANQADLIELGDVFS